MVIANLMSEINMGEAPSAHESPRSQLGLELQSHLAAAVASRTAQIKTTGDEASELVSVVSQKVANLEERGLQGAASLGKGIRTLVFNFNKNLASGHLAREEENHQPPPTEHNSYAEAAKTSPNAPQCPPKRTPSHSRRCASHHNLRSTPPPRHFPPTP